MRPPNDPQALLKQFKEHWRTGNRPSLAEFLTAADTLHLTDLSLDLMKIDLEYRIRAGDEPPLAGSYFHHPFPWSDDIKVQLIGFELQCRWESEQFHIRANQLAAWYPEFAGALGSLRPLWNCPGCDEKRIPFLDELAEEATCPQCDRTYERGRLFAKKNPVQNDTSPGARRSEPRRLSETSQQADPWATLQPPEPDEFATLASPVPLGITRREKSPLPELPGYSLIRILGRGGMGMVYLARQLSLDRMVAVKMILSAEHAGETEIARFRTEAEAVARLQHPNIVQIHEVGEHQGKPFFTLEYCSGGSLAQKIDGTPMPPRKASEIVETIARAMHVAHERRIIHRDLKPANVLLTADGQPKITDFGLAKKLGDSGQTQTGDILGTPSYMAPEQAAGLTSQFGPLVDVYAIGAILYELLTGRPPFKAANPLDTLLLVKNDDPVPPTSFVPRLPRDLETICLKCLEKDPPRRYASARDLADDLKRFSNGEPILARSVGPGERLVKWARRKPAQSTLAAVSVVTLLAFIASGFLYARYERQQAANFREKLERVEYQNKVKEGVAGNLLAARKFESDERWTEARTELASALAVLDAQQDILADELRQEIVERLGAVRNHIEADERKLASRNRLKDFQRHRDDSLFHETLFTGLDLAVSRAKSKSSAQAGLALYDIGKGDPQLVSEQPHLSTAEFADLVTGCYELLLIVAEAEANAPPKDAHAAGHALELLGVAKQIGLAHKIESSVLGEFETRYSAQKDGVPLGDAAKKNASPKSPLDWFLAGLESYRQDRFGEARKACDEVLRREPRHFWANYLQSLCQLREGRWVQAKAGLTTCLIQRPEFVWPRVLRGLAASEIGFKFDESSEMASAEADLDKALTQDQDPLLQYAALVNRGVLFIRQNRWPEAVADFKRAAQVKPDGYQSYLNLAQAYQGLKQWDDALAALDDAISRAPKLSLLYESRAKLQLARDNPKAARLDFEAAIANEPPGTKAERLVGNLVELGRLQLRAKDADEALVTFERALSIRPNDSAILRLMSETFLVLGRNKDAAIALDRHLALSKDATAEVYLARGLLHAQIRQYSQAIEMYTLALRAHPGDAQVQNQRGWTYWLLDAIIPAREDFETVLRKDPENVDALCGRGRVRARLRQVGDAVADAEAAGKKGTLTDRQHYHLACLYTQLAAYLAAEPNRGPNERVIDLATMQARAIEHLDSTLTLLPLDRRGEFWKDQVLREPGLTAMRRWPTFERLARDYRFESRDANPPIKR